MVINSVMPSVDVSEQFQRDPLGAFLEATRHGDVVHIALPDPMILINHPQDVRSVLLNTAGFRKPPQGPRTKIIFGNGLVTSEGEAWKQQRKVAQPAFHAAYLRSYSQIMSETIQRMLTRWLAAPESATLDIAEEMRELTLSIAMKALFGELPEDASWLVAALTALLHPATTEREFHATLERAESEVFRVVQARQRQSQPGQDLLSLFIEVGFSQQLIRDELLTFWIAGYDTTAAVLAWLWYLLAQHPEVEQQLHVELDRVLSGRMPTVEDFSSLNYTDWLLQEVMRLYPPVWATNRLATTETTLGNYRIPAGSMILLSPYTTHRHPSFWSDPERFDPERFAPEQAVSRPHLAYFPFGSGPRQCIGNQFALHEAKLILLQVTRQYRLRLSSGYRAIPEPLQSLRIHAGLPMFLERVTKVPD